MKPRLGWFIKVQDLPDSDLVLDYLEREFAVMYGDRRLTPAAPVDPANS